MPQTWGAQPLQQQCDRHIEISFAPARLSQWRHRWLRRRSARFACGRSPSQPRTHHSPWSQCNGRLVSGLAFFLYRRHRRRQRAVDAEAAKGGPTGTAGSSFGVGGDGGPWAGLGSSLGSSLSSSLSSSGPPTSQASLQSKAAAAGGTLPYPEAGGLAGGTQCSTLLPLTSSAPTTPSVPSTSLRSGGSAEAPPSLSRDPLLSYLSSQVAPRPSGGSTSSPGLAGVDVRQWEVQFSDLVIQRGIGEGSYGRVYLATWFGTEVAVKILIVGHVDSASEAQRALSLSAPIMQKLEAEASLLASLRHPHVINFLGICLDPPAIVTEYCARGSLCDLLAAARTDPAVAAQLTWRRRLAMAADAAAGMLYLHSRSSPAPIIHRDLKSPNLLVDSNWSAKVTDFNLSKMLEDTTHSTSMAAMNPRWLAPEVMRGGHATKASDVYSWGIVMHVLLTWQLPFGPANPWHLVAHVLAGGRLDIRPRDTLPGPDTAEFSGLDGYISLMQRCWAQAPDQRLGFQQVVQELRALLELAPPEEQ